MLTQIINGKIFTPQGWLDEGSVLIRDNKILEVTNCDLALIGAKLIDAKGMYIVPGYVCMHAHGGGGHDFNECTEEAFRAAVKAHQKHGATSIFPTLSSSPFSEIRKAVAVCETLMNEKDSPVLGLHVEGPYLNPKRAGEQFAGKLKNPDKEEYIRIRFPNRFNYVFDVDPALEDLAIPRFIIQPVVENAIYHGLESRLEKGTLTISCHTTETGSCALCVTDDGVGIPPERLAEIHRKLSDKSMQNVLNVPAGNSLALVNIHNRLRNLYGANYGLDIVCPPEGGTRVTLHLPMLLVQTETEQGGHIS